MITLMFDSLKGMAGMAGIMKDLPRIKAAMDDVRERLGEQRVEAETGGGAVRAVANGRLHIVTVHIDQTLFASLTDADNPDDRVLAEDLITGAVNAALEKAREMAEREMIAAAQELGLPMPPGGLGGLLS